MIHALTPYPAMKDSGVPWLGPVPEHWDVVPNRAVFAEVNERGHADEQMLSVTITQGIIKQRELLDGSSKKDSSRQDKSAYKLVHPGDIAYNKMRAWQGALGASDFRGIVSPAYVVVRPRGDNNPAYFHHLMRTPTFAKEAERWSYGITSDMWSLRPEHFRLIYTVVPPPAEQAAIVRYLDHADRRIRRTIAAKQKLIKLLQEQKQVIIHQAVTRGLDPDVKLKPSGVEWLGDVPEGWTIAALRLRCSVQLGKMLDTKRLTGEHSLPYLRNTDVQWGKINIDSLPLMDVTAQEYERYTVRPGDLLVCEGGEVGRSAIWANSIGTFAFQKALHRIRPLKAEKDSPEFLFYVFFDLAKRGVFKSDGSENTIAHLTAEKLRAYRLAFPPYADQAHIVDSLKESDRMIDISISRAQQEIFLLREYRTRLIADVVTGKLDVRDAAALLPEAEAEALPDEGEADVDELEADEAEVEEVEA